MTCVRLAGSSAAIMPHPTPPLPADARAQAEALQAQLQARLTCWAERLEALVLQEGLEPRLAAGASLAEAKALATALRWGDRTAGGYGWVRRGGTGQGSLRAAALMLRRGGGEPGMPAARAGCRAPARQPPAPATRAYPCRPLLCRPRSALSAAVDLPCHGAAWRRLQRRTQRRGELELERRQPAAEHWLLGRRRRMAWGLAVHLHGTAGPPAPPLLQCRTKT